MIHPAKINIEDYNYPLNAEKIAKYPLAERDASKLLVLKNNKIEEKSFRQITNFLPQNSLLLFNETRVIQARMKFKKETGAQIEIFCLEPHAPVNDFQLAFQQTSGVVWKCLLGNAKRWKSGQLTKTIKVNNEEVELKTEIIERLSDSYLIKFIWDKDLKFHEIIENSGLTPLPPYLNREAEESDKDRYQTVYAHFDGSVAAPTAGLHFTESTLNKLNDKGIKKAKLTLHVGAGTFKPVSTKTIGEHEMHTERIIISRKTLILIKENLQENIIPVGTTSMRTLESLFWLALKIDKGEKHPAVEQWDPYSLEVKKDFTPAKAINTLLNYLDENELSQLESETRLMIAPSYEFRFASGIITNFHQPKSTLLLLVSALIGKQWKEVYNFALENNFRFLSYGDSCLFLK